MVTIFDIFVNIVIVTYFPYRPTLHRFRDVADHWSDFRRELGGGVLFNSLVRGEPLNL